MKYILRFLCAVIIYPLFLIYCGIFIVLLNIGLIIWYFNTKHLFWFNYRFYIVRDGGSFESYKKTNGDYDVRLVTYDKYYKTPYDMMIGNLTTEYK